MYASFWFYHRYKTCLFLKLDTIQIHYIIYLLYLYYLFTILCLHYLYLICDYMGMLRPFLFIFTMLYAICVYLCDKQGNLPFFFAKLCQLDRIIDNSLYLLIFIYYISILTIFLYMILSISYYILYIIIYYIEYAFFFLFIFGAT